MPGTCELPRAPQPISGPSVHPRIVTHPVLGTPSFCNSHPLMLLPFAAVTITPREAERQSADRAQVVHPAPTGLSLPLSGAASLSQRGGKCDLISCELSVPLAICTFMVSHAPIWGG
jgi:hypothetical protein